MKQKVLVKRQNMRGKVNEMTMILDPDDYERWISGGGLIQNVMPYLTPDEREFLMTGTTPEEWNAMFKNEDN